MYYSVIRVMGEIVLLEDPEGDMQTFTKDFFNYDVQENDLVTLYDQMFHLDKVATEETKKRNFSKLQDILGREQC